MLRDNVIGRVLPVGSAGQCGCDKPNRIRRDGEVVAARRQGIGCGFPSISGALGEACCVWAGTPAATAVHVTQRLPGQMIDDWAAVTA